MNGLLEQNYVQAPQTQQLDYSFDQHSLKMDFYARYRVPGVKHEVVDDGVDRLIGIFVVGGVILVAAATVVLSLLGIIS